MTVYSLLLDQYGRRIPKVRAGAYEAAGSGRRLASWETSSGGPNSITLDSLATIRRRARQLIRNNPMAENGVDIWAGNLIGTGIVPRWRMDDEALRKALHELWTEWTEWTDEADADGLTDFYGLQYLVARSVVESGEVFVRFRARRPEDGLSVPLQLQVLEADLLDESHTTQAANGNEIRMGIELDRLGRRRNYWFFQSHPGESFLTWDFGDRVPVPASEICHIYLPRRPGQLRGLPWLASVIVRLYELDSYEDAELVRKKGAAMFGGFLTEAAADTLDNPLIGKPDGTDENENLMIHMEPGMYPKLPPGTDIKFSNPADVGDTYEPWIRQQLRAIAVGIGITYEQLTRDLSNVNFSSILAGLLEFRRRCEALQWHMIIYQFCRPVLWRWLDMVALSGALNLPGYYRNKRPFRRVEWKTPGWPRVDPESEVTAHLLAVKTGFESRSSVIAERGDIPEEVYRQLEEDNKTADKRGLVLSTDLRKTDGKDKALEEGSASRVEDSRQATPRRRAVRDAGR
ncbi:MAG: phage portal protein [Syntrophobacteraceae bacterium]